MPVRACERVTKRFGALSDVDQPSFAADGYESLGFLAPNWQAKATSLGKRIALKCGAF